MAYRNPIMICDADEDFTAQLQRFLHDQGHRTVIAPSGADALLGVRGSPVDIVVLDIGLSDIDGVEVVAMLRHRERTLGRRMRIIALTAHGDTNGAERVMEAGAFFYLSKPVSLARIAEQVSLAIEQVELERGYIDEAAAMTCSPEQLFDQMMQATLDEAPKLDATRFAFDHRTIVDNAPELAGVITLRDAKGFPLYVEWTNNVRQRLTFFVALEPTSSPLTKLSTTFDYALGNEKTLAGVVFDKLYNELGGFPRFVGAAPPGSKYHKIAERNITPAHEAVLTNVTTGTTEDLAKLEALHAINPADTDVMDWLAFRYLSEGLLDKSVTIYRELIAAGSKRPEHHFYLGNALYKLNAVQDALRHWEHVARQTSNHKLAQKAALRLRGARQKHG